MVSPTLAQGGTTITLKLNQDLSDSESPKLVIHSIPSRNGDIIQDMGRNSKKINLNGYTTVQSEKNTLKNWAINRTVLVYNDDENSNINVRIFSFNSIRKPSRPSYYEYSITIIEDE